MRTCLLCSLSGVALFASAGVALAQTTPPAATPDKPAATTPNRPAASTAPAAAKLTLTEAQAKSWIGKPVYSSDGKDLGEIVAFTRASDNAVQEMHADIGGFLGMGETRVKLTPQQFKLQGDRAVLNLTQEQAKSLPKVEK
jgi:hypothetical protein